VAHASTVQSCQSRRIKDGSCESSEPRLARFDLALAKIETDRAGAPPGLSANNSLIQ
jgi:hypothetical protein